MPRIISTRTLNDEDHLVDGVPEWMMNSVLALVKEATTEHRGRHLGELVIGPRTDLIHAIERQLHHTFARDEDDEFEIQRSLLSYCQVDGNGLDILQAVLAIGNETSRYVYPRVFEQTNQILVESGSKWIAVEQSPLKATLEERVDQPTADAYANALEGTTNSSKDLLKTAWGEAFGREPNASEAYSNAIKAMEAAAWPVITPNNDSATLGHILGELNAHPAKWRSAIVERTPGIASTTLANAMQLVWEGHTDRHGTAKPLAITQEAAEQAVFTAVMICDYFNRNYVVEN